MIFLAEILCQEITVPNSLALQRLDDIQPGRVSSRDQAHEHCRRQKDRQINQDRTKGEDCHTTG